MNKELADEVVNAFEALADKKCLSKQAVLNWMANDDLLVRGVLYAYITKPNYAERISPRLDFDDYFRFIKSYAESCIIENVNEESVLSRYEAGWELVSWFSHWWKDESVSRSYLNDMRDWIGELYKTGNADIKECIVNAALEHLFENRKVAQFFADWRNDPVLQGAYNDATLWTKKGGKSPKGFGFGEAE